MDPVPPYGQEDEEDVEITGVEATIRRSLSYRKPLPERLPKKSDQ